MQNTSPMRLAIIGTAGRDRDKPMNADLWDAMCDDLQQRLFGNEHLISGGAAWADHLAVHAYHSGWVNELTLFLPAPMGPSGFLGPARSAASAANYYHQRFSDVIGRHSYQELRALANCPSVTLNFENVSPGYSAMFARNAKVAAMATGVIAYTFGQGTVPADGGTRNTWDQICCEDRTHVALDALLQRWKERTPEPQAVAPRYYF